MKLSNKLEDVIRNNVKFDETAPWGYVVSQSKHIPRGRETLLGKVSEIEKFAVKNNGYCKVVGEPRIVGDSLEVRVEMNCNCVAAKVFDAVVEEKGKPFIYLSMNKDTCVWSAVTSPQRADNHAVRFCEEKEYPVDLYYVRTDINGSISVEKEVCENQRDLIKTLNWCGECGYTPLRLWDFNVETSLNEKVLDIFEAALQSRLKKIAQCLEELEQDSHEGSLDDAINTAKSVSMSSVARDVDVPRELEDR